MTDSIKCDICGGDSFLIHTGTRDNPNVDVHECAVCHTKQLSQIRDNDYASGFMNGTPVMSEQEITKRIAECKSDDLRRAAMVAPYCKDKDVLDFGCGFGGFLTEISTIAKSAVGVELGTSERNYLTSKGFVVENDITHFRRKFEVITLFHVFEHLANPKKWLNVIADNLTEGGGVAFIEVPNANDALLSLYKNESFADFTYWSAHLYLYTVESLTRLINANGKYTIESVEQIQRYPLSNHLYWLANGKPGGHKKWDFLNDESLNAEYKNALAKNNYCDTLFFRITRNDC